MSDPEIKRPKVLVLLGTTYFPPFIDQLGEMHSEGKGPRAWLLDIPGELMLLDQRFLTGPPKWRLALYRRMPIWAAQILEAFRVKRHYDVVFAWGAEPVAIPFALLLKLTRSKVPLVTLFNWVSQPKKAWFLRLVHSHITTLIVPSRTQQEFIVNRLRIPRQKVPDVPWGVDEQFWQSPDDAKPDMICSVGREMRDFGTLIKALDGTGIPCHIAAVLARGRSDQWRQAIGDSAEKIELPGNVTVGSKNPVELRELYARSRFVVLPLLQSDTDNGTRCLLEAWSMRRPVICSEIDGQRGAIDHGRNGLFVPVGDVETLRKVMVDLWKSPEESRKMGIEGRQTVMENNRTEHFTQQISHAILAAAAGGR